MGRYEQSELLLLVQCDPEMLLRHACAEVNTVFAPVTSGESLSGNKNPGNEINMNNVEYSTKERDADVRIDWVYNACEC
jgi:hypothetical protein